MYFRKIFARISKQLGITYGQKVPDGWTIHDLRHTSLTNLALAGVPLHGIKEFAGHASITETERYLKYMPEQVELAASVSTHMAQLANLKPKALDDDSFAVLGVANELGGVDAEVADGCLPHVLHCSISDRVMLTVNP